MGGSQAAIDLVNYLQSNNKAIQQTNLLIVGLAYTGSPGADGVNSVGYGNVIIVRCPYVDPTTGSTTVNFFGGSSTTHNALRTTLKTATLTTGALINLTHQTNIVLRVITREMDSTARVRPDNL
jgi:hypothetical protein